MDLYSIHFYIRVPYGSIKKGMFRQFRTGDRIFHPADLLTARLAYIRMPCCQGSITRKIFYKGRELMQEK